MSVDFDLAVALRGSEADAQQMDQESTHRGEGRHIDVEDMTGEVRF